MISLVPCAGCTRHVRASDRACPFCGAAVATPTPAREGATRGTERLSRAALMLLGAASIGGCDRVKDSTSGIAQPYGSPPIYLDAGRPLETSSGLPQPTAIAAPYGAPPIRPDAGAPTPPTPKK